MHPDKFKEQLLQLASLLAQHGILIETEKNILRMKFPLLEQLKTSISLALSKLLQEINSPIPINISIKNVTVNNAAQEIDITLSVSVREIIETIRKNLPMSNTVFKDGTLIVELTVQ